MENYLHNVYTSYFKTLKHTGYINDSNVISLLILTFIYDLVYNDYRGLIAEKDYNDIEKAITCLFGSNCLIPYKDYLKMGRLHIGDITELRHKICSLQQSIENANNNGVSLQDERLNNSLNELYDVINDFYTRLDNAENNLQITRNNAGVVVKPRDYIATIPRIDIDNS